MIFISHNFLDKELVEEMAHNIALIYGQENVFYDSWSIQPGDGIINKMNAGLEKCRFFFFFVSKNSLQSDMVKLEWQSALYRATKGNTKFIPIRIDDCAFPAILMQTLYIDIYGQGIDVGFRQMIDVINGNNIFRPNNRFHNIRAYYETSVDIVTIEFKPQFYMEPISKYAIILDNEECEISWSVSSDSLYESNIYDNIATVNNRPVKFIYISVDRATTPSFPVIVTIKQKRATQVKVLGAMKGKNQMLDSYENIPLIKK